MGTDRIDGHERKSPFLVIYTVFYAPFTTPPLDVPAFLIVLTPSRD